MTDPFQLLGVPYDATEDVIKVAYRKLAMELHPDRNPGNKEAEERFKAIASAYDELKDPVKRQMAADRAQGRGHAHGFGHGGHGWHNAAGGTTFHFDFDDILAGLRTNAYQARPRNTDINVAIAISLEDAFKGKEMAITIQTPSGPKHITTTIPRGVDNGTRIRIQGQGEHRYAGAPGDLFLNIKLLPHGRFERVAQNLFLQYQIDVFDALLGCEVDIEGIDGQTVRVTVPAGVQPGQRLRVGGHGMPLTNGPHIRGDLIVQVHVGIPVLNDDQQNRLRDFRASL